MSKRHAATTDHRVPIWRGGQDRPWNCVAACQGCNHSKGPLTHCEFAPIRDIPGAAKKLTRMVFHLRAHAPEAVGALRP